MGLSEKKGFQIHGKFNGTIMIDHEISGCWAVLFSFLEGGHSKGVKNH